MKCIIFWHVCCYLFVWMIAFSLSSCEEGLSADQPINGGLSFNLIPASFTAKDVSTRVGTTVFAGALTREQELVVHDLCYFEFAGNHVEGATCLAKGYISSSDLTNSSSVRFTDLTGAAGTHTLYLVANLGDVTGSVVADPAGTTGTALSALKALTFTWTTRASNDGTPYTAGTDFFLPMTGSVTVDQSGTYTAPVTTPLQRRVARVNVSIESQSSTFVLTNIKLLHVPKNSLYSAASTAYPDASVSGNFDDTGTLVDASSPGYYHTWYIPENRRNSNDNNQPVLYVSGEVNGVAVDKEIAITATPNAVGTPTAYEILPNYEYDIRLNVSVAGVIDIIDLSLKESANSYICNKASQFYMFSATVQGNGTPTPGADGLASTTADNNYTPTAMAPNAAYTARVLWSMGGIAPSADTDGGDASTADNGLYCVIKKGTLAYDSSTGYISFETTAATLPAQAGNAVIGLFNGSTLLWSWHIWFTDYDPSVQYDAYKTAATGHPNPLLMMKYNLGATNQSGALSDVANTYKHGFHYQWGRKDPFLGGVFDGINCIAGTEYYYNKYGGVADFVYNGTGGSLALGYGNPMTFYTNDFSSPYDWQGSTVKNDLWGNPGITWSDNINSESGIKTCFDPCPPGWKVPPRGTWSAIFATTTTGTAPNQTGGFAMGYNFYYTAVGSGPTTFYPVSGLRSYSSGALSGVGSYGYYWCSSPSSSGSTNAGFLDFNSSGVGVSGEARSYGFSVRCAQE